MEEFDLIRKLTRELPRNDSVVQGPGDDCAVLDIGLPDKFLLMKTDAVVEGVHFTAETPPRQIGRKALGRCLSDFAAMAGAPGSAVITLGLPTAYDPKFVEEIYQGLQALAAEHGVAIVGGETTTNPERIFISVAIIGFAEKEMVVYRRGAKAKDVVFVTGELGGSIEGRHLSFEPRLAEAIWLRKNFPISSMIDLSDGLAGDLRHILDASQVGAVLNGDSIPVSRAAKLRAQRGSQAKPPLIAALTDGEDFELAFTVASAEAVPLLDAWKTTFPGTRLTCVGRITAEGGLRLKDKHGVRTLNLHGYSHFKKP